MLSKIPNNLKNDTDIVDFSEALNNKNSIIDINCNIELASEIFNERRNYISELEKNYETKLNFIFESSTQLNEPLIKVKSLIVKNTKNLTDEKKNIQATRKKIVNKKNKNILSKKNVTKKRKITIKKQDLESDKDITKTLKDNNTESNNDKKGWWDK